MTEISNPHDSFFKELFSRPDLAADFLQSYLPEEVAALLDGIESALRLKFGAAGLALMPEIRAIEDVDVLRAVHAATITALAPQEVRAAF